MRWEAALDLAYIAQYPVHGVPAQNNNQLILDFVNPTAKGANYRLTISLVQNNLQNPIRANVESLIRL